MDIKNAFAGTLESGDILIQIAPSETGTLQVDLESSVAFQFGEQIKKSNHRDAYRFGRRQRTG